MKIEIEKKPGCEVDLRVEFSPEEVNTEWNRILGEFRQYARIPGFRPGKAPEKVIERKYRKEIHEEMTKELVGRGIRSAIKEHELDVLRLAKVKDIVIADDRTMSYATTIVTSPQFDLPKYKGLTVKVPPTDVCGHEIEEALEHLRAQHAEYPEVTGRALALEDYAVLDYSATCNGKPLAETAPEAAKFFGENKDFWLRVVEGAFLPGFVEAIVGMKPEETREFDVAVGDDFPREDLRGLTLHYSVTLKSLRTQKLPDLDDAFAALLSENMTLESLRDEVRKDLKYRKDRHQREAATRAALDQIMKQVEFDLPAKLLKEETRRTLEEIVEDNRRRGVEDDELAGHKDELVAGAERGAQNNLKSRFILLKIAKQEKIEATEQDLNARIHYMAYRWRMNPQQLRKELEKRDAIPGIQEDILVTKALEFITNEATFEVDPSLADHQHDHDHDRAH